jgi:hypothetical protein
MNTASYKSREQAIAVRRDACSMAADVMASRPGEPIIPTLRSVTMFFEAYITGGAEQTEDFGLTREAAKLIPIAGGKSA